ncbi:MAG: glycosyltransferase family 87 protein [Chloroflexia bacterium]
MENDSIGQQPTDQVDALAEAQGDQGGKPVQLGLFFVLLLFVVVFIYGAWSWTQFFAQPQGVNSNRVVLFTQTDFPAIVIASRILTSGQGGDLYDLDRQLEGQQRLTSEGYLSLSGQDNLDLKYPYPYSPFIAVLWSPLSGLSPLTQMALWDVLNLVLMAGGLWYLLASLPMNRTMRLLLLLGGLTSFPFIVNLQQGQSSGIVMFAWAMGFALLRQGRDLPAGLAFGLLALKVQWIPLLLLVLVWKRRWKALLGIGTVSLALLSLTILLIGTAWIGDYIGVIQRAQQGAREFLLDPWYSHSLTGGLTALFGRDAKGAIRLANLGFTLLAAGGLLYVWRGRWSPGTIRWEAAAAITFLATALTNSHLNTHDLSLLVLPAALGMAAFAATRTTDRTARVWLYFLPAAYLVISLPPPLIFGLPVRLSTLAMLVMLLLLYISSRLMGDHVTSSKIQQI